LVAEKSLLAAYITGPVAGGSLLAAPPMPGTQAACPTFLYQGFAADRGAVAALRVQHCSAQRDECIG
jgi:hypothetical protein